jgi:hypothetical protein
VILALDPQFSIDLQLIGGVLILQTLPPSSSGCGAPAPPLALLGGWAAGMVTGVLMLYDTANPTTGKAHFGGPQYAMSQLGFDTKVTVYTGLLALLVNLAVTGGAHRRVPGAARARRPRRHRRPRLRGRGGRARRRDAARDRRAGGGASRSRASRGPSARRACGAEPPRAGRDRL